MFFFSRVMLVTLPVSICPMQEMEVERSVLISSILQILDRHQVQAKPFSEKPTSRLRAASSTESADRMGAFVRSQTRKDEPADEGSAPPPPAGRGNSGTHATRHGFTEFLRAVEDITRRPSSPVLDLFQ